MYHHHPLRMTLFMEQITITLKTYKFLYHSFMYLSLQELGSEPTYHQYPPGAVGFFLPMWDFPLHLLYNLHYLISDLNTHTQHILQHFHVTNNHNPTTSTGSTSTDANAGHHTTTDHITRLCTTISTTNTRATSSISTKYTV